MEAKSDEEISPFGSLIPVVIIIAAGTLSSGFLQQQYNIGAAALLLQSLSYVIGAAIFLQHSPLFQAYIRKGEENAKNK